MASFLVILWTGCVVVTAVNGFIEVGVYSKLETTQSFTQSAEIKGWKAAGSAGLGSFNAVKPGSTFDSNFSAPLQGIYYASTNLVIEQNNHSPLKTSILVNRDVKRETGLTGLSSNNGSVTVSGLVQLSIGDVVTVYVESENFSKWTLFSTSTFFVQIVHSLSSYPAFQAGLSRDFTFSASTWRRVEDWDASSRGFRVKSAFSPSLGTFCASCDGIYQVQSNIILELAKTKNVSVALFIQDRAFILQEGYHGNHQTASMAGVFNLKKGDCIDQRVRTSEGAHRVLQSSGFSTVFLSSDAKHLHAASYRLNAPAPVLTAAGLHTVGTWKASGDSALFESSAAVLVSGTSYKVQRDGQYFIATQVNIKASSPWQPETVQLLIIIDKTSSSAPSSASIATKKTISSVCSLSLTGVLYLSKGQTITPCIHKDGINSITLTANSLFSVSMVPKDWPGVSATLNANKVISTQGWNEIGGWKIGDISIGSFSFDSAFDFVSGRYVIPLEGVYVVSCNVILNTTIESTLKLAIAVNGNYDNKNALYSIQHSAKERTTTISASGSMWLSPGQNLSMFVHVRSGVSWSISRESGLSIALAGTDEKDVFLGVKTKSDDHTASGWQEVTGWHPRDPAQQSDQRVWDSSYSRYTPIEDGLYLVSANLLVSHSAAGKFRVLIIGDGHFSKSTGGQNYHSAAQSAPSVFSFSVSCSMKLTASHYVSVFVKSETSVSYSVLGNSSISITLMSGLTNHQRAGMNAITIDKNFWQNDANVKQIIEWDYKDSLTAYSVYKEQIDLVSKVRESQMFVNILEPGLYYFEVATVVRPGASFYQTFTLALCVGEQFVANAMTALKVSDGPLFNSEFGHTVYGVLYLAKDQRVSPCIKGGKDVYFVKKMSGFSLVRIVQRDINLGLRQIALANINDQASRDWTIVSDWTSKGESSLYELGSISPYGQNALNAASGTFFLTSTLTLNTSTSTLSKLCITSDGCDSCLFQGSLNTGGLTLSGSVRLRDERVCTCVTHRALTVTRSVQFLPHADENTTFLYRHGLSRFNTVGPQSLSTWTSGDGQSHAGISVTQGGLYVVAINIMLRSASDTNANVTVSLDANGGKTTVVPGLSAATRMAANTPTPFGLSGLVRIQAGNSLTVVVQSDSSLSWEIESNATFSAALLTKDSSFQGLAGRIEIDRTFEPIGAKWLAVGAWVPVDIGFVARPSNLRRGRYVVDVTGIYLMLTTFMVSVTVPKLNESIIELLISIDGDVVGDSSLKTSRVIKGRDGVTGSVATLSIASSMRLSKWQVVLPMVRSTPAQKIDVIVGSTFYMILIDKPRRYSTSCADLGPNMITHPTPFTRVAADVCKTISLQCEAVSGDSIRYKWIKDGQYVHSKVSPSLVVTNARVSDTGRYFCIAESSNVSVASSPAIVQVFETLPIFSQGFFDQVFVVNESSLNVPVVELNFTALTATEKQANVSFRFLAGNVNDTFSMIPTTSTNMTTLTVTSPLDYETIQTYRLVITATNSDTRQSVSIFVTVNVEDTNDNRPSFRPQYYNYSVPEDAWLGASLVQVSATDRDSGIGGQITYAINAGNDGNVFAMNPVNGFVVINAALDYEDRRSYTLVIAARDLGSPSLQSRDYAYVTINVTDSNDNNPVFQSSNYSFSIPENSVNGSVVGRVQATDKDVGTNGGTLYNIQDMEMQKTFSINHTSGEIVIIQSIDYEVDKDYAFIVMATDQGISPRFGVTLVRVLVVDTNDNFPVFDPRNYTVNITEATTIGTEILRVHAADRDSRSNGNVKYAITDGNTEGGFRVTINEGAIIVNGTLNRENKNCYNLVIEAVDSGSPAKTSLQPVVVVINVDDANDNYPEFLKSAYTANFSENAAIKSEILRVQAVDQDSGSNSLLRYSLDWSCSRSLANQTFAINETSGVIYLASKVDYDVIRVKTFRFQVEVKDGGMPSLKSLVDVIVMVTDVNDNYPQFTEDTYNASIPENTTIGYEVLRVQATDQDSGSNSFLTYYFDFTSGSTSVVNQTFHINSTSGIIYLAEDVDYDTMSNKSFVFEVGARDDGSSPRTSVIRVVVVVTDVNDNPPVLLNLPKGLSIPDNFEANKTIFSVNATDSDSGKNARLTYTIEQVKKNDVLINKTPLAINNNSGRVFLSRPLAKNSQDRYELTIQARDLGTPSLSTNGTLTLTVRDVNDHPKCGKSVYELSLADPSRDDPFLLAVTATDQDVDRNNSALYFELSQVNITENCEGNFSIDSDGRVYTEHLLTRECEYILRVLVRDRGEPALSGVCHVKINIEVDETGPGVPKKSVWPLKRIAWITVLTSVIFIIILIVVFCVCRWYRRKKGVGKLSSPGERTTQEYDMNKLDGST